MIKIRKYTLKNKHKKRLTGGSDNNRNLNRKQRRQLNRALPKLQAAVRSRISNNSPTPSADSTVLPEPPMIISQNSPITVPQTLPPMIIPQTSPITVQPTQRTRRRRGRRTWRSQTGSPILWYNISPEEYLRQTQNIPVLQPIPIPAAQPITLDSEDNEIININDESNNEYQLSIDRKGNVTVLKDGSLDIEEDSQDQTGGAPNDDLIRISAGQISTGNISEEIEQLQTALDNGANINTRDNTGRTALSHAVSDSYYHNTGNSEIVEFLLENGADVNLSDNNDMTPLIWSVTYSNIEFARILLENNADPNIPDGQLDQTPLHIATQIPFLDLVILLLENGANVNPVDMGGDTPLHVACTHSNDPRMFETLLRYGADENIQNHGGQTASDLLQNHQNLQLRNILVETRRQINSEQISMDSLSRQRNISDNVMGFRVKKYLRKTGGNKKIKLIGGTPDDDLLQAVIDNDYAGEGFYVNDALLDKLRIAIESGANVNIQTSRGYSPLIFLAKSDVTEPNIEMVDLLLRNGANPNLQDRGGETALHWASARGFLEMVEKLLESENIDINITNIDGRNALHSIFDDEEEIFNPDNVEPIMKLLIEKGININETDDSGKTALHLAAEQNRGVAIGVLLRAGADENIKTYDYDPAGQTAYELAENIRNRIELRRMAVQAVVDADGHVEARLVPDVTAFNIGDNNPWVYEPLALNAFHEFHDERAQAAINNVYLAQEAKNEDSYLNSLPDELEEGIRNMFGGSNYDSDVTEDGTNDAHNVSQEAKDDTQMREAAAIARENASNAREAAAIARENASNAREAAALRLAAQARATHDLLDALRNDDLEQMRIAIESGADVNMQWGHGRTVLISLADSDENEYDTYGEPSPGGWPRGPNIEMVDLLLNNNADPNLQDSEGDTALHWATARGYLEIVEKLLENENIEINKANFLGRNALHIIFTEWFEEDEPNGGDNAEPIMKLLIEKGININEQDNSGKTPLHLAAEQNNSVGVGILLRAGANENIKTGVFYIDYPDGHTAYELAEKIRNSIELDRNARLGEIIGVGNLTDQVRITHMERDLVRAVMTVGEEERSLQIPRDILVDEGGGLLWSYEPVALNAFHEFHDERAQAAISNVYLAQEAKNEDSYLNSLPDELEEGIRNMLGGVSSTKELQEKMEEEFPEILQNMFDESVILDVKIEDDKGSNKNHKKYIVTVYIQDQPDIPHTMSFVITSSTKPGNNAFNEQKKKVKDWLKDVITEKRDDLIEHMVDNQYTIPQPQKKSPTLKQDLSKAHLIGSPISPSPRSPTKSKWTESEKAVAAKKQEYIHDNFNDAHTVGFEDSKGDEESEDTEDEAAAKKELEKELQERDERIRRLADDMKWSPQQRKKDRKEAAEVAKKALKDQHQRYAEERSRAATRVQAAARGRRSRNELRREAEEAEERRMAEEARRRAAMRREARGRAQLLARRRREIETHEARERVRTGLDTVSTGFNYRRFDSMGDDDESGRFPPGTSVMVKKPDNRYLKWEKARSDKFRKLNDEDYENGWIRGTVVKPLPAGEQINEGNRAAIYSVLLPNLSRITVHRDTDDFVRKTGLRFSLNTVVEVRDYTQSDRWMRGRVVRLNPGLNDENNSKGVYLVILDEYSVRRQAVVDHDMLIRTPITSGGAYNKTLKEIVQDFKVSNH